MEDIIRVENLTKIYHIGDVSVNALQGVDISISRGEFVSIMGASGSGKSTLMNIIGCLDYPTSGNYYFEGVHINQLSRNQLADIRNQKIGFVFQTFNLLARTAALENVELPLLYDRSKRVKNPIKIAMDSLERVGLADRLHHETSQLSGGEQQRVAIARSLVNNPSIILADEPTGNLDTKTSIDVISVFQQLNDQGITVVLVTHEPDIARYSKRIIKMRDGKIIDDKMNKQIKCFSEDDNYQNN